MPCGLWISSATHSRAFLAEPHLAGSILSASGRAAHAIYRTGSACFALVPELPSWWRRVRGGIDTAKLAARKTCPASSTATRRNRRSSSSNLQRAQEVGVVHGLL